MTAPERFDVIVAGFGPTGATLAARLGQLGISTLVLEKDADVYPFPRAAHFDHEVMRVWQRLGIAEAVLPETRPIGAYEFRNAKGEVLMRFGEQAETVSGWRSSYMFHQPALEYLLRAAVARLPSVQVRLETALDGIVRRDAESVAVRYRGAAGAGVAEARFLIACDGAASPVRKSLGIGQFDYQFDEPWLVIDTIAEAGGDALPQIGLQHCNPARPTTFMPMSPGRYRWEFMILPGEWPETMLDEACIYGLLGPWSDRTQLRVDRKAVYRFHGLVATAWRAGPVLLAGDAAHQMPPFMGQGLCSGVRDAENLAWKLAAVLRGEAGDALLNTYQLEREPHVRAIIEGAIFMGRVVCTLDPTAAAARDAQMLAARKEAEAAAIPPLPALKGGAFLDTPLAGTLAPQCRPDAGGPWGDEVWGPGFVFVGDAAAAKSASWPVPVRVVDAVSDPSAVPMRAALAAAGVSGALVRPDRTIFGTGEAGALALALKAALRGG